MVDRQRFIFISISLMSSVRSKGRKGGWTGGNKTVTQNFLSTTEKAINKQRIYTTYWNNLRLRVGYGLRCVDPGKLSANSTIQFSMIIFNRLQPIKIS